MLREPRLNEAIATDTFYANTTSIEGFKCAQVFVGCASDTIDIVGMKTESDFIDAYKEFMRDRGIPHTLRRDNAQAEKSNAVTELNRDLIVADAFTEPHHPHQNPAELRGVKRLKNEAQVLMDRRGAPDNLWFGAMDWISKVHNVCASPFINDQIPDQVSRGGGSGHLKTADLFVARSHGAFRPNSQFSRDQGKTWLFLWFCRQLW